MTTIDEDIPGTYQDAVRTLARWHAEIGRANLEIFAFHDPCEMVVRLLEVSDEFPDTGGVIPVTFGRSTEFPFKSSVALVTPGEWQQILSGTLPLPDGWDLATRRRIWPNEGA
jgi:hypothetical protein